MKTYIFAALASFAFTPAAFAACASGALTCNAGTNYAQQYGHAPQTYAPAPQAYNSQHGYAAPQPVYNAEYEDEVVVYEERARKRQSYYFNPRDYRSFKCRSKNGTQKCTFEFRGDNADDVEFYLAQALIASAGTADSQAQCYQSRRSDEISCAIRGDLRYMDPAELRYALYGR